MQASQLQLLKQKIKKETWLVPVEGSISSPYGLRDGRMHHGIDIKADKGTKIRSSSRGRVAYAGRKRGFGELVIIEFQDFQIYYAHCQKLLVSKGDWVEPGRLIALVGDTGRATGAHLHLEIRTESGFSINPAFIYALNFAHSY
jgi:murein DD-endopeptidase MepM/ murein hydrolase activator NlpD